MPQDNAPSPNGPTWFYAVDGQTHGPVPTLELRLLLKDGRISRDTLIAEQGAAEWTTLISVFPEWADSTPPALPPQTVAAGAEKPKAATKDTVKGCSCGCLLLLVIGFLTTLLVSYCTDQSPVTLTEAELNDPRAAAETLMRSQFGKRLLEISVNDSLRGLNGELAGKIGVRFLFQGYTLSLSKGEMRQAMKTLFKSGLPLYAVEIRCQLPMVDKYGNESPVEVYEVRLQENEAAKINWDNVYDHQMDEIWEVKFLHHSLRN